MSLAAPSLSSVPLVVTTASSSSAVASLSSMASSIASNKYWVGSAWMVSSAILTTYSTTKFLKHLGQEKVSSKPSIAHGSSHAALQFDSILNNDNSTQKYHRSKAPQKSPGLSLSRASLLTLYRFSGSLLLGLFLHSHFYQLSMLIPRFLKTINAAKMFLLPSLFLFIANYSNSIALDRIGISLTYTSKCGIPLITVLFTLLLDGISALPSNATLLSLVPIALGIGASSWNSPTFEALGFLAALVSTTSQAALNVVSKRVMKKTGVQGVEAQRAMVFVALGIGLLMTAVNGIGESLREQHKSNKDDTSFSIAPASNEEKTPHPVSIPAVSPAHPPLWLTCLAVLAYHMEYVLSFSFVGMVEPITYGTCDALRRLLIIVAGKNMFGGAKFSNLNLGGMMTALLGAIMFSITSAKGASFVKP
ncbi:hypothetical protein ACHAW5_004528 [Stephanodiscus triporus]|uniref:Sugar phosphate transporter domain-containing protein n=1 Tax=Stephanodiscus triporus TaxID=2934178 RepID=A0ABD3P355_9STRA